jgi:proteasome lid subunit RPN8/RPN11
MMTYSLTRSVREELHQEACLGAPHEVCGFAFGGSAGATRIEFYTALRIPNAAKDPVRTFEIDGATFRHAYELANRAGLLLAIWHSHPDSAPTPSKEDFALISQLRTIPFIIVGVRPAVITVYEADEQQRVREASRMRVGV